MPVLFFLITSLFLEFYKYSVVNFKSFYWTPFWRSFWNQTQHHSKSAESFAFSTYSPCVVFLEYPTGGFQARLKLPKLAMLVCKWIGCACYITDYFILVFTLVFSICLSIRIFHNEVHTEIKPSFLFYFLSHLPFSTKTFAIQHEPGHQFLHSTSALIHVDQWTWPSIDKQVMEPFSGIFFCAAERESFFLFKRRDAGFSA